MKLILTISKNILEYAAPEHGYDDEAGVGARELTERYVKLPKIQGYGVETSTLP